MAILVTCKYEEDLIKIEGAKVATTQNNDFSNTQGQLTPHCQRSDLVEIRTHPRYYSSLVTCKNEEDPMKNRGARVATTFFPL